MDRILFGDNQFFGVNHMSEEKARQQAMRFQDLDEIMRVLEAAKELGAGGFMCTTHDRIADVCDRMRAEPVKWEGFNILPCMPYAHKYANAVTELGYFDALRKFLPKDGLVDTVLRGGKAIATPGHERDHRPSGRCRDEDVPRPADADRFPAERRHGPRDRTSRRRGARRVRRAT